MWRHGDDVQVSRGDQEKKEFSGCAESGRFKSLSGIAGFGKYVFFSDRGPAMSPQKNCLYCFEIDSANLELKFVRKFFDDQERGLDRIAVAEFESEVYLYVLTNEYKVYVFKVADNDAPGKQSQDKEILSVPLALVDSVEKMQPRPVKPDEKWEDIHWKDKMKFFIDKDGWLYARYPEYSRIQRIFKIEPETGKLKYKETKENVRGYEETLSGRATYRNLFFHIDEYNHQIMYYITGRPDTLHIFGQKGTKDGEFDFPYGLALFDKYLLVADAKNKRIQILEIELNQEEFNLKFIDKFTTKDKSGKEFMPVWMAIFNDFLYVSDENATLHIFNLSTSRKKEKALDAAIVLRINAIEREISFVEEEIKKLKLEAQGVDVAQIEIDRLQGEIAALAESKNALLAEVKDTKTTVSQPDKQEASEPIVAEGESTPEAGLRLLNPPEYIGTIGTKEEGIAVLAGNEGRTIEPTFIIIEDK